ncbi:MAG TPA: M48 family metallopeptidase [Pseudomonadales bacterium]|nr:M48 family metallopeptidase [Pseudomonadales bacterium]
MATMDFFEAQAQAHRTTLRLIGLFIGAVVAMIVLTVLVIGAVIAANMPPAGLITVDKLSQALTPTLVLGIAAGVLTVVAVASVFRLMSLSGGGRAIAESLGARLVQPNTDDAAERQLLNVVEEMAIASGLPVPPVFVVEETGINAFAAGYGPDDAVLGITEGALARLDRDELQGIVGHEFSHILNGDMRLNIRLMSVLFGIMVIGLVGRSLIGSRGSHRSRSSSSSKGAAQAAMVGLGLMIVGYVGTFFGSLIKAAVSRQREFLADASSVQFTRNPEGISRALQKIGAVEGGSRLRDGRTDEISHMFFSQSFGGLRSLFGLLATHPPLATRIKAVDPRWNGEFEVQLPRKTPQADDGEAPAAAAGGPASGLDALHVVDDLAVTTGVTTGAAGGADSALTGTAALGTLAAGAVAGGLGQVRPSHVAQAHALIDGIPEPFYRAVHDPYGARAAIYVLFTGSTPDIRSRQLDYLDAEAETGIPELARQLAQALPALPHRNRLPLVLLAAPALKTLSAPQYARFKTNLAALIRMDGVLSRFEWVLHQVVMKELRPHFEGVRRRRGAGASIRDEAAACATLLSALARAGHGVEADQIAAFDAGIACLDLFGVQPEHDGDEDRNQHALNDAMRRLRLLNPLAQPKLLKACIATVEHDGMILDDERDLLQGVAAALDCPLPPLSA